MIINIIEMTAQLGAIAAFIFVIAIIVGAV